MNPMAKSSLRRSRAFHARPPRMVAKFVTESDVFCHPIRTPTLKRMCPPHTTIVEQFNLSHSTNHSKFQLHISIISASHCTNFLSCFAMSRQSPMLKEQKELVAAFGLYQEGLGYFEQGKISAAQACFHSAFTATSHLLREARNREYFYFRGSPVCRQSSGAPTFRRPELNSRLGQEEKANRTSAHLESKLGSISISPSPTDIGAGARLAKLLSSPSSSSIEDDQDGMNLFSRILDLPAKVTLNQFVFCSLYNLALSTHLSATLLIESADAARRRTILRQSSQLWDLIYPLQWTKHLNLRPCHGLAILLNMGHAKQSVGSIRESETCFRNIISAVWILETRQQEVPEKSFYMYQAFVNLNKIRRHGGGSGQFSTAVAA
jgi:hypothetical protein